MDSFLVGLMQETLQNITWFLFGIEQHEHESQPQQIKLSDAGPTPGDAASSLSQTFSFLSQWKWTCFFAAQSPSRNTCLPIPATPICWPLGLGKTPYSPALSCAQLRGSGAPQVQGRLFPHPVVSKHDYLSSLQSPAGSSFRRDAWLAAAALDIAPAPSDPLHHLLCVSSCSRGEHLLTLAL